MIRRKARAATPAVLAILWILGLPAGAGAAPGSLASACSLDFQLFCGDLDPESPRAEVADCLSKNRDVLTEECRAVVDPDSVPRPRRGPGDRLAQACREDFQRFCGQEADRMSFARCVRSHRSKLSLACQDAIAARGRGGAGRPGGGSHPRPGWP